MSSSPKTAVIAGVGPALGSSLCHAFANDGYKVAGLSRHSEPISSPVQALNHDLDRFVSLSADLTSQDQVEAAFAQIERELPPLRIAVYNVAKFHAAPFAQIRAEDFEACWRAGAYGALLFAKAALPLILAAGGGSMIFTGATASVRGGNGFAAFAAAKFAMRGLVQSLAREYGPQGVHVVHTLIDGKIARSASSVKAKLGEEDAIDPDDLARLYVNLAHQPPSSWTQELDVRPASEKY
ncbi:MAG: SDR family NAD(P)-dependent oxidoreductase [Robiginitomaculum sp.]|nr:SDR family NAD(P)-dependent oxidoreductase [Robiginitomaculum sp.]MDQ7076574.1 SDR family NAD(P)-dependent oxidoreductase [Robiginitomaculum sp.]